MENYIEILRGEQFPHCPPVPDIRGMQASTLWYGSRISRREVVHDNNTVSEFDQLGTTDRADITGTARNQDGCLFQ